MADPGLSARTEKETVLLCQQGDCHAFRRVVDFHGDALYRTALLITRNGAHAEEAVQETLLLAWRKIHFFTAGTNLRAWLNRLLVNTITDLNRRKRLQLAPVEDALRVADRSPGPAESLLAEEVTAMLRAALETLSFEHRTVFVLRYFNEMTVPEIAEHTGWKQGTVMSRLHRATAALRTAVAAREGAPQLQAAKEEA
jgi:RNA polymerase sigma-70 factor (ECF subfamily)